MKDKGIFKLKVLCTMAGLEYWTVYAWLRNQYQKDLNKLEKTALANAILEGMKPFLKRLGYEVVLKKK